MISTRQIRAYIAKNGKCYYEEWIDALTTETRNRIMYEVNKLMFGLGFQKDLKQKLWVLKIDNGPGYRVYFYHESSELILLLAGSLKKNQQRTIALCRKLITEIEEDKKLKKG